MPDNCRDDPILGPALAYWILKRGMRAIPLKRDRPTEILPKILPHLQIIDIFDGGKRFRYWLVGTALAETYGKDYTGSYADEFVSGERLRFIQQAYQTVCTAKHRSIRTTAIYGPYLGTRALRARGVTFLAATIARQGAPA